MRHLSTQGLRMHAGTEVEVGKRLKGMDIPPCPGVLSALLGEMEKPEANAARMSALISQDVALAAGVMKIANSDLFAPARQVGSIAEALSFLGFGKVFNMIVGELLRKSLADGDSQRFERFWDSAAHTATVSAQLALALPGALRDNAYCFGLFRDCAIPILSRRFADYKDTLRLANRDASGLFTRHEEARHGTQHAVIGCLMARNWGLAAAVEQGILCHHDYDILADGRGLPKESLALIGINAVAEHIVALQLKQEASAEWGKARHKVGEYFGLSQAELEDLVDDLLHKLGQRRVAA
jgi:HD-like signal output (HDOD) protein